jgi:hypothetical protein
MALTDDSAALNPRGTFEGQPVLRRSIKLGGTQPFEQTLSIDQTVRLVVDAVVTGVDHRVDPKSEFVIRVHTLKVEAVEPYLGGMLADVVP